MLFGKNGVCSVLEMVQIGLFHCFKVAEIRICLPKQIRERIIDQKTLQIGGYGCALLSCSFWSWRYGWRGYQRCKKPCFLTVRGGGDRVMEMVVLK